MSGFKGTPGPWVIDGQSNGARWNIDDSEGYAVAMSFQRPDDKGYAVRDANANLIAAAPELLEALQNIVNSTDAYHSALEVDHGFDGVKLYQAAVSAISKALGEGTDK